MPSKPKATALSTAGVLPILRHSSWGFSSRFIFLFVFSGYDSWFRLSAPNFCLSNAGLSKLALRAEKYLRAPILFYACNGEKPVGLESWCNPVASDGFYLKVLEENTEKFPQMCELCHNDLKNICWDSSLDLQRAPALRHFLPCDFSFCLPSAPLLFGFLQPSASSLLSCKQLQKLQYDSVFFLKSSK